MNIVLWGEIIRKEEVGRDKVLPGKRVRWCREFHYFGYVNEFRLQTCSIVLLNILFEMFEIGRAHV